MKVTRAFHPVSREAARLLGARIREARSARRWTQRELAERVGTTPATISKVERGDLTVGVGLVFDAAVLVGVPLFVEDRPRLAAEADRAAEVLSLLPRRVRADRDVDDAF
jgi:transcriptional regulator with XRE-family HTH domain